MRVLRECRDQLGGRFRLGAEPTVCNVFALVPNCYYAAVSGTDTFHLSNHFARPGQVISGTYSWEIGGQGAGEFPSYGSVRALTGGPGLKLLGCTGRLFADNRKAAYKSHHAFDVTEGHATCRWKATAVTPWSVALGLKVRSRCGRPITARPTCRRWT